MSGAPRISFDAYSLRSRVWLAKCRRVEYAAPGGRQYDDSDVNHVILERPHLTDSVSISTGIAARYATALFELSLEAGSIDALEKSVAELRDVLVESEDLRTLISSPVYTRDEMASAISAVAERMNLDSLVRNTLALMASKRRLFVLPAMLDRVDSLVAEHKGVITVEVVSAEELGSGESESLKRMFRDKLGKDIRIDLSVDRRLIGGLSAKIGSRLVDASIRTRLSTLRNLMQGVG